MNRKQAEIEAPWATGYYDEGYEQGRKDQVATSGEQMTLVGWMDVMKEVPEQGRRVLYFFDMCGGAFLGYYFGTDEEYPYENNHVFGNGSGFLTGDVTHWMYLPDYPIDHDEIVRNDAANASEISECVESIKKPINLASGFPSGNDADFGTSME